MVHHLSRPVDEQLVRIPINGIALEGDLAVPRGAFGIVLFAHGSGSSRHSSRNRAVASRLQEAGFATLLFDLLTASEERIDRQTAEMRFDIPLLAARLVAVTTWLKHGVGDSSSASHLPVGYFGASTGAAAAIMAAAQLSRVVHAVVSRGGRPDLAGNALESVDAPTLLIVGGSDHDVLELNREAALRMRCTKSIEIVPRAGHLFEEPGALEHVAELAIAWFRHYLALRSADQTRTD